VRRDGLAVVTLALAGSLACASHVPPQLGDQDVVSGCDVEGSTYVKVLITLKPDPEGKLCLATVSQGPKPEDPICVFQGGAVRFKVVNGCGRLIDPQRPALRFIQPEPRRLSGEGPDKKPWSFATCSAEFPVLTDDKPRFHFCEVPSSVLPGRYKYGLEGQIVKIDPDVEVRRGNHP